MAWYPCKVGGDGKLDIMIDTVASSYTYLALPKTKKKLYAEYISGQGAILIIYGIPELNSLNRTQIASFTLSSTNSKVEIDFGDYEYISINHKVGSGQGRFRLVEE